VLVCHFVDRQLAEPAAMNASAASLFYVDLCEIVEPSPAKIFGEDNFGFASIVTR
jgi:hypothetical protein